MSYIIFDLEWNQPMDGKDSKDRKLQFEILEIGAVKLDEDGKIIDSFNELVRPTVYKQLNWHTQKMLNIKMKDLKKGEYFPEVCERFLEWCGEEPIYCTWGTQDLTELQRNMKYYEMKPLSCGPIPFFDVQRLFSLHIKEEEKVYNLESAVDKIKLEKDIPFHRAFSDAYYTARIFSIVDRSLYSSGKTYDLYHPPLSVKEEIHEYNKNVYYYVSRCYDERQQLVENKRVKSLICYKCGKRAIRPKTRWFSNNSKNYYGTAYCMVHGPIVGKMRIRQSEHGGYYAEKFMKYTDASELKEIKERKNKLKIRIKTSGKDSTGEPVHSDKKTAR